MFGWIITLARLQPLQPSTYSQGEKNALRVKKVMRVAVGSFVKMCEIFKCCLGDPLN